MIQNFCVYLETAGNAVPKVETVYKYIDILNKLGYNKFYLGCQDTFKIESEPYFGYMRGGYTIEELQAIDNYCVKNGITFVINTQTLAHQTCIPAYQRFKKIMDFREVMLCDSEDTYFFIEEMIATLSKCLSSKIIHLGMDEAFGLGAGKYYSLHGPVDRKEIFLKHLVRVCDIAKKYGLSCEIWSDMFFYSLNQSYGTADDNIKELIESYKKQLPENLKIVYWNYSKQTKEQLVERAMTHKKICKNISFATTLYNWIGFVPDNENSVTNAKLMLDTCNENGVEDYILTIWSDSGRDGSVYSILPSLYVYSEIFKNKATSIEDVDKDKFFDLFGVKFDDFMLIDKLNKPFDNKKYDSVNNKTFLYLYNDPFIGLFDSYVKDGIVECFPLIKKKLQSISGGDYQYIFDTLIALTDCLTLKSDLGIRIRKAYLSHNNKDLRQIANNDIKRLKKYLKVLYDKLKIQWEKEMRPFGFEIHIARLGSLILRLQYVREKLLEFVKGKVNSIEELEEKQQPFGYNLDANEDNYFLMCWINIFTSGLCL